MKNTDFIIDTSGLDAGKLKLKYPILAIDTSLTKDANDKLASKLKLKYPILAIDTSLTKDANDKLASKRPFESKWRCIC